MRGSRSLHPEHFHALPVLQGDKYGFTVRVAEYKVAAVFALQGDLPEHPAPGAEHINRAFSITAYIEVACRIAVHAVEPIILKGSEQPFAGEMAAAVHVIFPHPELVTFIDIQVLFVGAEGDPVGGPHAVLQHGSFAARCDQPDAAGAVLPVGIGSVDAPAVASADVVRLVKMIL